MTLTSKRLRRVSLEKLYRCVCYEKRNFRKHNLPQQRLARQLCWGESKSESISRNALSWAIASPLLASMFSVQAQLLSQGFTDRSKDDCSSWGTSHVGHTRIYHLDKFLQTIQHNASVASLITTAAFELYGSSIRTHLGELTLELMASAARNLGSLRIATGLYKLQLPTGIPLTRLSLHRDSNLCAYEYLHSVFTIPTLVWISISGIRWCV